MQESRKHRTYDKQFKGEAVKLVTEGGRKVTDAASSLGIHENLLHTWKRKHKEDPSGSFPGKGHLKPEEAELRRLQRENASLKEDSEILKKALAIFFRHRRIRRGEQNTPDEILVHGPASLLAWGAEDVPGNRSIKERILPVEETASEQEAEGK